MGWVMRIIGGPCVLAGPRRYGGYNSDPLTGKEIVVIALMLGVVFALAVPFLSKAKGHDIDM